MRIQLSNTLTITNKEINVVLLVLVIENNQPVNPFMAPAKFTAPCDYLKGREGAQAMDTMWSMVVGRRDCRARSVDF